MGGSRDDNDDAMMRRKLRRHDFRGAPYATSGSTPLSLADAPLEFTFLVAMYIGVVGRILGCPPDLIARRWRARGRSRRGAAQGEQSSPDAASRRDRVAGNSGNVRISLLGREGVFEKPLAGQRAWATFIPRTYDNPERREGRQVSGGK